VSRTRTASIRRETIQGNNASGSSGPDSIFVVDLIENGQCVESRKLPGKNISYAQDVAENWENGLIQLLTE
tara:strand:+ start:117 stop:329 length:213 start_codon:yes stop_codon:yes gene_type:complete